ncbi:uncharacterized protein [Argopecten irradians]|uniref:uncharacterized protein n=1 Tax=Argopecten irradians TaxID=31199 RepID=UPI00371D9681
MDRQTRRASEYVNEAAETSSGIYYNDTAESIPEDYDDFVGIATVSPAWYKMALNMPANYWKQPNKRDEYEDYRKPRRIKPPDVKLPLPPLGRRQTREINRSLPPADRGQSRDIRLPLPPQERRQNRDIKLYLPPPDRRKSNACVTVSVLAILTVAVMVAVPLLFIYIFTEETPSTTGTVKLDLTLSDRFLPDMADTSSSVFRSTELELSIEIEKAIKSYPDFPKDTFRECRLESLRNGSITASLVLTISGVFTIPDNNVYIMAITVYIGSVGTLGRYTVVPGSIVVTSATYTTAGTAVTVTSHPTTPSVTTTPYLPPVMEMNDSITAPGQAITMSCIVRYPPSDWEDFSIVSVDNADIHGRVYPNGTVVRGNNAYTVELQQSNEDMTISILFPNITTHLETRGSYLCTMVFSSDLINKTADIIIPEIEMNDTITTPGEEFTINCNVRYPPSDWEDFSIVSVDNTDIRGRAYPNGTVVGGIDLYQVGLQRNGEVMIFSILFPNTTTHCTARGRYMCTFGFVGNVINQTSTVIISDIASGVTLEGNITVEEGERYSINCSGRLATEGGSLDLFIKSRNSSDFVKSDEVPILSVGDIDDSCYRYITQTYDFLADSDLNGTEFQCVATNDKLASNQSSSSIDMVVDFADFKGNFHLQTTTWIPAFADTNSPEFKSFADKIEGETNYVYSQSVLNKNYKKSKVVALEQGSVNVQLAMFIELDWVVDYGSNNVIKTKLTPTDIITAFTDTLPGVSDQLPDSPLTDLNPATVTVIAGEDTTYDCSSITDVVFLLDASGSIGSANFVLMKYFIQNYTAGLELGPEKIQVSVAKFSSAANNEFWLNEHYSVGRIGPAINAIVYTSGGTDIKAGLEFVKDFSLTTTYGARPEANKVIILMTDGRSGDSSGISSLLRNEGVLVACVGIGSGIDRAQLNQIAYNSSYIFLASDFNVLAGIAATVKGSSCEN